MARRETRVDILRLETERDATAAWSDFLYPDHNLDLSHISVSRETLLDGHSVVAAVGERVLLALEGLRAYVQPTRRLLRVREADDVELDEE